jgi:hypothetical protein
MRMQVLRHRTHVPFNVGWSHNAHTTLTHATRVLRADIMRISHETRQREMQQQNSNKPARLHAYLLQVELPPHAVHHPVHVWVGVANR